MLSHAQETSGASQPQVGGGGLSHLLGNPHRTDNDAVQGKVIVDCFLVSFCQVTESLFPKLLAVELRVRSTVTIVPRGRKGNKN